MKSRNFITGISDFHALTTSIMKLTYAKKATLKLDFIEITKISTMIYFKWT